MANYMDDINDGGLPRVLSGLGQTRTGLVFDDGPGTVMTLMQGVRAPRQVRQMQRLLNQFGYKLIEDGIFGGGSAAAVRILQKKLKMAETGVYDKALDERVTGMNQSGIIEATPADKVVIVAVQAANPPAPQTTATPVAAPPAGPPSPKPTTTNLLVNRDVKNLDGTPAGGGPVTVTPPPALSFMNQMKAKWALLRLDPNFKFYAAGAAVVALGGLVLLTTPKKDSPRTSQMPMQGLHWPKKRKSRKSKKS